MVSLDEFYSASKAALGMIIKELAIELAPHNIRVNGIAPGNIKEDEKGNTIPHRYTPLYGSSINPCYIGRAAVYLSSDYYSRYTTGTVIKIDGGLSLYNHLVDKSKEKY
jgi:NAD(P)-dependent dehydrogenase (short-subunit alcohol dehydrogenase family)